MMKRFLFIVLAVALCFGVGLTAAYFQSESMTTWYPELIKPDVTPPNLAFPIAWGIIYICMGSSIGLVWGGRTSGGKTAVTSLFLFQLLLNFLWSFSFFYLRNPMLGFLNIVVLDIAVLWYTCRVGHENKWSMYLFVPYLLWLALATYLNGYIMMYN